MNTRDDVRSDETVTNTLASVCTGTNGGVDRTRFATDQNGHVAAANELTTNQTDFCSLGHGIRRFNSGNQTTRFDHTQSNTSYISHLINS
ncbi:hypothetical protein A9404_06310 [Halothiobacillus diazotrophicus]|uniref:Uncharacterized protein n=1 Tax=Halothiobacillus diazotrophicus TaxID=1860122 RepID=A0A191ZGN4_9GAMM|nr:hypothetical protein A9404_06310 [Halothiobacillus diazotrophicus]